MMGVVIWRLTFIENLDGSITPICVSGGNEGCIVKIQTGFREQASDVDYFVAPGGALQDSALDDLAKNLNQILSVANDARKDKNSKLGLLLTPRGYMGLWKYEEGSAAPPPQPGSTTINFHEMTDEEAEKLFWPGS